MQIDDVDSRILIARGDAPFGLSELQDMLDSRAFKRFAARIDQMIEYARTRCESADSAEAWRKEQGALEALRRVKQLPDILAAELKESKK